MKDLPPFRIVAKHPLIFVLLLLICSACRSQEINPGLKNLDSAVNAHIYAGKFDSAQATIIRFLTSKTPDDFEKFYCRLLTSEIQKSTGHETAAIKTLEECLTQSAQFPDSGLYRSLVAGNIAECYFNVMNYDSSSYFAKLSLQFSPDKSLRSGGHAVNYIVIGFGLFKSGKNSEALTWYDKAIREYSSKGETCELPLCYLKIALVHDAVGNGKLAMDNIRKAERLSDSCGIESYKLLTKRTLFEILKENGDYEEALYVLMEINKLVEKIENGKRDQQLEQLRLQYETQIISGENEMLKNINRKNAEILAKQKQALIISVTAMAILTALLFLLIRVSRKRKSAESAVMKANQQLEMKVEERTQHLTEANKKIKESSEMLDFQNKQLVDFCNIISHNLRSPLHNISSLVGFIESSNDLRDQKMIIAKLRPALNNLNLTFDELVESLQIKQDTEIKSEHLLFSDCLKRTLTDLEADIISTSAIIKYDFSDALSVYYPRKYLFSIFHNLISNAIKYRSHERPPEIMVKTIQKGESVILTVEDNGMGIDIEKHGSNLFKIRKTFHEHPDAKGFGLFITRTQIEAMSGKIWAESTPGKGSVFCVVFPRQKEHLATKQSVS